MAKSTKQIESAEEVLKDFVQYASAAHPARKIEIADLAAGWLGELRAANEEAARKAAEEAAKLAAEREAVEAARKAAADAKVAAAAEAKKNEKPTA